MSILFISLFIAVLSQDSTDSNRYLISLTGNTTKPSDYVTVLDVFKGAIGVDSLVSADTISVDKKKDNMISISKTNGDIAVDLGVLSAVDFQSEGLSHEKFYLNYTLASNKIYNTYMENSFDNDVSEYQVGCSLVSNDFGVNITTAWNSNITKIVTYSYASFGIVPGDLGAYYLTYKGGVVNVEPLSEFVGENEVNARQYLSSILYSDIWVINQPYDNRVLLALKDKTQNNFYFFTIALEARTPDEIKQGKKIKLSYYTDISLNQTETYVVNNVGIYKNDMLIGTDKGLYVLRKGNDLFSRYQFTKLIVDPTKVIKSNSTSNSTESSKDIPTTESTSTINNRLVYLTGFAINELTVYAIFSGYGMIIIDPNRDYEINEWYFRHPYLTAIDIINNPYLGNKYTGLSVKNQNQITEFFIELLVDNEFHPFLNKVYVSNEIISNDNALMVDLFYTYLFNKVNRQLIIIRRGLINAVSRETVVINIERIMSLGIIYDNPMVSLYDTDKAKLVPAIPFTEMFYIMNDLVDNPNTLVCSFQKSGNYSISYTSRTELCQPSIASKYIYSFCQKTVAIRFNVIGGDTSDYDILVGVFVTVFGLVFIAMIVWFLRKTQCCTNFKAFKIKKQANINRVDMYLDHEPEKIKKNTPINDPLIIPKDVEKSHDNWGNYVELGKGTKSSGFGGFESVELRTPEAHKMIVTTNAQMLRAGTTKKFKTQNAPVLSTITPNVENIQIIRADDNNYDYNNVNSPPRLRDPEKEGEKFIRGSYDYNAIDVDGVEKNLKETNDNVKRRKKLKRKAKEAVDSKEEMQEVKKDDSFEY
jgi:hypothetical protein